MMEMNFDTFKMISHRKLNLSFEGYKDSQLQRRLNSYMQKRSLRGYPALLRYLQDNPGEVSGFRDYLTINVSEFFRNADMFQYLSQHVFPEFNRHGKVKIWSAGCSVGCEAYSLGILAAEQKFPNWSVLATDIDNVALSAARAGVYDGDMIKNVSKSYLSRYFVPVLENKFQVKPSLKKYINYQKLDLLRDHYPGGMDLVACRNVVIYFTEEAKNSIFSRLCASLRPGGVLFIGATEGFHDYREHQLTRLHPCIYQKS